MATLKERLGELVPKWRADAKAIVKEHGEKVISEVTVAQAFGGMRGVKGMICDTSVVEPDKGLIIRGQPLLEGPCDWSPEKCFWVLITGEEPSDDDLKTLQDDLKARSELPAYVYDVLRAMPKDSHPMTMLNTGILSMQHESVFARRYAEGMKKKEYWEPALEDAINLLGSITTLAAAVYRLRYGKGDFIAPDPSLDWGANYAHCLGNDEPDFYDLMRLYLTLHSDHEAGNVSANTCHTVGSALSDPYYAVSAGLNGLAGPLHGLANQECLGWVLEVMEKFGGVPTKEQLEEFAWETLNGGKVIPGYGHAVLRVTDPRYVAFNKFGKEHCADDPTFATVNLIYEVVPDVLKKHGKAKNPWPNVDAGSGCLLYKYGITEFQYYTVFFSVSRAMGMLSQLVLNRGLGTAITRPKSVSTEWIKGQISA